MEERNRQRTAKTALRYYVMVTYDGIGNPDRVAVKGKNSDELLKHVQNVMRSGQLESLFEYGSRRNPNSREKEYYGYSGLNGKAVKVSCSVKAPKIPHSFMR